MPIWKMIIEIVPVVTAKPGNVISNEEEDYDDEDYDNEDYDDDEDDDRMTTSEVSSRKKITMMKIMMKIMMKMMKTIMKKMDGVEEITEM